METVAAILINIGCSIIASIITVVLLPILYSSKIKISPFIVKRVKHFPNENIHYAFKIVNMSIFEIRNLTIELRLLRRAPGTSSAISSIQTIPISLVADHLALVEGYRPTWLRKDANNCIVFRTLENIEEILHDDNCSILITATSQHSLTSFTKTQSLVYHGVDTIREGNFMHGPKFAVLPPALVSQS